MIAVLEATNELVTLPDNDFSWSSWNNADEASSELRGLIAKLQAGTLTRESKVGFIFSPAGPLQEVSLSSGWAETCLEVSEIYDAVAAQLWKKV